MTASKSADCAPAAAPAGRLQRVAREFALYFACSAVALAADGGLFAAGIRLGLPFPVAAAIGFIAGLWIAYTLSVRFVFGERRLPDERAEFMVFAAIGAAGLVLTELLLWLMISQAHWSPGYAKVATAGFVFCFNFGVRRALLFTRRTAT